MNEGSNPPPSNGGGKGRRRRRRRGSGPHQPNQQQAKSQGPSQGQQHGHGQGQNRSHSPGPGGPAKHGGGRRFGKKRTGGHKPGGQRPSQHEPLGGVYSAPMDHSYRAVMGEADGNVHIPDRNRGGAPFGSAPQVPAIPHDAPTLVYAFVDDLFFLAKINETARKLGIKVEFVKTDKDIFEKMADNGNGKPSLIIVDLNNVNAKPLTVIPKLKSKLKKETNIIGFVSHVQGELKMKAQEAGCDMVLPRSAFSQNLAQLLRRHTAPEEDASDPGQPN